MTVAVAASLRLAFVALGTQLLGEYELHQLVGQHPHTLAQRIRLLHTCLVQHF